MTPRATKLKVPSTATPRRLDFTVYHSKEEFEGTCYMEIMPAKYAGRCWDKGSISIEDVAFGMFEWAFARHSRNYDHYAFTDVPTRNMLKVADDLGAFVSMIKEDRPMEEFRAFCRMATTHLEDDLERALKCQREQLTATATEISQWIRDRSKETKHFAVLGI